MMKKPCKECPWVVRNKNNNNIIKFSKKKSIGHNCHMTDGYKDLWSLKENFKCAGWSIFINDEKPNL